MILFKREKTLSSAIVIYNFLFLCFIFEPSLGSDIFPRLVSIRAPQINNLSFHSKRGESDSLSKEPLINKNNNRRRKNRNRPNNSISTIYYSSRIKRQSSDFLNRIEEVLKGGYYFGVGERFLSNKKQRRKEPTLEEKFGEILLEMKKNQVEMENLRRDLKLMKRQLGVFSEEDDDNDDVHRSRKRVVNKWNQIGLEVERWAEGLLRSTHLSSENGDDGWKEIKVSRLCSSFNKDGRIKCYLKWMEDSRGSEREDNNEKYPCIVVETSLDAPMDLVCQYLSDENTLPDYNALVMKHCDLCDIAPHSKICWGQSPKILFIKPRNFVTFCHHRWRRDGTQIVVNQACRHEDYIDDFRKKMLGKSEDEKCPKAFALRGANFISPHPKDPNRTLMKIVAHANPGSDISPWMCRLAVDQLVRIEPFKLFHKINQFVKNYQPSNVTMKMVNTSNKNHCSRPGGLSQMGYACFWPNGGGLIESTGKAIGCQHQSLSSQSPPSGEITPNSRILDQSIEEEQAMSTIIPNPHCRSLYQNSSVTPEY